MIELEPALVAELFGDRVDSVRQFAGALSKQGETLGLIGPLELSRLWSRHIINCALLSPLITPGIVGDVGSGAGLPGLVLAIARPEIEFVLIEPMGRRVSWLQEQVNELQLKNVKIVHARAEDSGLLGALDQVTARAVSALRTLIPLTAPLLRDGGGLVLLKGSAVDNEITAAEKVIRKFQVSNVQVKVLGEGQVPSNYVTRAFTALVRSQVK